MKPTKCVWFSILSLILGCSETKYLNEQKSWPCVVDIETVLKTTLTFDSTFVCEIFDKSSSSMQSSNILPDPTQKMLLFLLVKVIMISLQIYREDTEAQIAVSMINLPGTRNVNNYGTSAKIAGCSSVNCIINGIPQYSVWPQWFLAGVYYGICGLGSFVASYP